MKSRGFATMAAIVALGTGAFAAQAPARTAHAQGGGQKNCTRNVQRSETTRFESRNCMRTSATSARADMRIRVRSTLPTMTTANNAKVRVRERVREEERNGDTRVRVRTEHRRRVEGNVLRDEVRIRIDVRNADHPQITIGTASAGALPITVTQLGANGQPVVLRTLTVTVPQAQ
jgi:hypothetical protein